MANISWQSPDGKIKKTILEAGSFGPKPAENSICSFKISDIKFKPLKLQSEYLDNELNTTTIGEANTALDREIHNCLLTMHKDEHSSVIIIIQDTEVSFTLTLVSIEFQGYIYEWDANKKCKIAQNHKEKGVELFKENRFVDASHRFSRGLKLILSIPIPVDTIPEEIDGVSIKDINTVKANLYNNLASCNLKVDRFETSIELCTKVLDIDENHVKALHKRGVACSSIRDFERAKIDLLKVLELDADNKAAIDKLQFVNENLSKQEVNYASMVKKMFK